LKHRPEQVQKGNPNELTLNQHILPAESIRRFCDTHGRVMVARLDTGKVIRAARPDDSCFVVERLWDQRTEVGFPARVESRFQFLVNRLLHGDQSWWDYEMGVIPEFYALWMLRAQAASSPMADIQMASVLPGGRTTKDLRERVEANFYIVPDDAGVLAGRFMNGIKIQYQLPRLAASVARANWRIKFAEPGAGEFIVPDYPIALFMPIAPTCALVGGHGPERINQNILVQINRNSIAMSHRQVFARDFAKCPL
jgi:hypothetical protein